MIRNIFLINLDCAS